MFMVTILFATSLAPILCASPDEMRALCAELEGKGKDCCTMDSMVSALAKHHAEFTSAENECKGYSDCDLAICIGEEIGFVTEDGKVIKEKAIKFLEEDFGSHNDIVTGIKSKCINGDVSTYGLPEQCELLKYQNCVKTHVLGRCTKWSTEGDCANVKQLAEDCLKMHT